MNPRPHRHRHSVPRGTWACLLLAMMVALTGCEALFKQSGSTTTTAHPGADTSLNGDADEGAREVAAYINFLVVIDGADEQGWHTIFEHTLSEYQERPTRESRLRLALVMSRADTKSTEPKITQNMLAEARKLFNDSLQDPAAAPSPVRKFTMLMLTEVDARLALYAELRSLRSQLAKAHQASQTANRDRAEAETRMRRINAALDEANAKLEAVMKIERNIGPTGKETFP